MSWLRREPRSRMRSVPSGSRRSIIFESWRRHYNTVRPHASLGYRPPAPEVFVPAFAAWPAALTRPAPPARLTLAQISHGLGCIGVSERVKLVLRERVE